MIRDRHYANGNLDGLKTAVFVKLGRSAHRASSPGTAAPLPGPTHLAGPVHPLQAMSVPQMLPTVEHSVPAIFEGGEDPEAVTALDVSIAPSARGKDEKKSKDGLARLRRDLRRSNETHDFAKGDEPAPTAEVPLTKSKGNGSFRSRRLSTEMVGESREKAEPPRDNSRPLEPVRDNTAEPSSKAGASSVLGMLRSRAPSNRL